MILQILLFGIATDLLEASSIKLEVSNNCTVAVFKETLIATYPVLKNINSYAIAVNERYVLDTNILKENDVIALIPPVSGG